MTQIAFSFVLLAGAGTLLVALVALQTTATGFDMRQVLAIDLPTQGLGIKSPQEMETYKEMTRRISTLPGVSGAALGSFVPWRDAGQAAGFRFKFTVEGFFAGRWRRGSIRAPARRLAGVLRCGRGSASRRPRFHRRRSRQERAGRHRQRERRAAAVSWRRRPQPADVVDRSALGKPQPRRVVGVVADADDEQVGRSSVLMIYQPVQQMRLAGRLFVRADGDPYSVVPEVTKIIRGISAEQPIERPATLADVRAAVLAPDRVNAFVIAGFAGVALLIAVVGVAGVLAFSVSARTREFGVRMAIGSSPRRLLFGVLSEGIAIVAIGIAAGAAGGYVFAGIATGSVDGIRLPGALPVAAAATVLAGAAVLASLLPAARASRIDVLQALRME